MMRVGLFELFMGLSFYKGFYRGLSDLINGYLANVIIVA